MSSSSDPLLLIASHGTRSEIAQAAVLTLVGAVTRALAVARPTTPVVNGYIDVQQPDVPSCLAATESNADVVIVPLLMSAGYHVQHDLANAVTGALPRRVRVTAALGPDPRLAVILAERLAECGLRDDDSIVLAAAGSSDTNAIADCHTAGEHLAALLGRPVTVAFIAAAKPKLAVAVAEARTRKPESRVVVASYLLAPGTFAGFANASGADIVSSPLLVEGHEPPTALVQIVTDLYYKAAASE